MYTRAPDITHRTERCAFQMWIVDDALAFSQLSGVFEGGILGRYIAEYDRWLDRGARPVSSFHDWEQLDDYDTIVRVRLVEWTLRRRARFERIHILTSSKLVRYGVAAANLALRGLVTTYEERARFEAAFASTLGGRMHGDPARGQ